MLHICFHAFGKDSGQLSQNQLLDSIVGASSNESKGYVFSIKRVDKVWLRSDSRTNLGPLRRYCHGQIVGGKG